MTNNYRDILNAVSNYYSYTVAQLLSRRRYSRLVEARHMAMYMCRTYLHMSYIEIGDTFERDHTMISKILYKFKINNNLGKVADYIARAYLKEY